MSEMTDYQVAVAEHMEGAPEDLAEYVRGRLKEGSWWRKDKNQNPISSCGFDWSESDERISFWVTVSAQNWQKAIATEFWKGYTAKKEAPNESPSIESGNPEHPQEYDYINPAHYQEFSYEVIEMMEVIWGKEATATHCEMCAFKYKLRAGSKPDQPVQRDLEKAAWYLSKAKELRS